MIHQKIYCRKNWSVWDGVCVLELLAVVVVGHVQRDLAALPHHGRGLLAQVAPQLRLHAKPRARQAAQSLRTLSRLEDYNYLHQNNSSRIYAPRVSPSDSHCRPAAARSAPRRRAARRPGPARRPPRAGTARWSPSAPRPRPWSTSHLQRFSARTSPCTCNHWNIFLVPQSGLIRGGARPSF